MVWKPKMMKYFFPHKYLGSNNHRCRIHQTVFIRCNKGISERKEWLKGSTIPKKKYNTNHFVNHSIPYFFYNWKVKKKLSMFFLNMSINSAKTSIVYNIISDNNSFVFSYVQENLKKRYNMGMKRSVFEGKGL